MTEFYYPATIDVTMEVASQGKLLSPLEYELTRVRAQKGHDPLKHQQTLEMWNAKSDEDLAYKWAITNHRMEEGAKGLVTEEVWLASVRLYQKRVDALKLIVDHPGVILGLSMDNQSDPVIFVPNSVALEGQLQEVHIRANKEHEKKIGRAFKPYNPKFYRVTKK